MNGGRAETAESTIRQKNRSSCVMVGMVLQGAWQNEGFHAFLEMNPSMFVNPQSQGYTKLFVLDPGFLPNHR